MPITADQQPPPRGKKSSLPLGLFLALIFAVVRLMPTILPVVRGLFAGRGARTSAAGTAVAFNQSWVLVIIVGIMALIVMVSIVRSVSRGRGRNDQSLPTTMGAAPPTSANRQASPAPRPNPRLPPNSSLPVPGLGNAQMTPQAPRFEPALRGKVVLTGLIVGVIWFGGLLLLGIL